ncbi:MAG: beta-lactamase family protein [Robiginitomaculum sp.]|nr:beta-lactamase family protein [Robiginitomaculum sp.]
MKTEINDFPVSGHVADGFEPVRSAFVANFADGFEAGAGFCVYKDGECLVDLIGGTRDRRGELAWQSDTLVPVFSTTKAVAALVIAWLVEQGRLDYGQTVASLWSAFTAHGKGKLTVAQVMSHQAGLSGITDPMKPEDWFDWDGMCARLAAQAPIWPPGTRSGYHPLTFGFLAGEIARLADKQGRTLGTILREEFCQPHDIDFFIGTPGSEHERCADLYKPRAMSDLGEINAATRAAFLQPWSSPGGRGTAAWRSAEFAAANGHGTAKSVAKLMQLALDGHIGEKKYLSKATLTSLSQDRISGPDLVLPFDLTFAAGLMLNRSNQFYGPNETTLGHSGWGGSCAFADQDAGITCAYVMNKQSNVLIGDERPVRLIEALYGCF